MSVSRISHSDVRDSARCAEFRLVDMVRFIPADAFWNLAIAVNVYMKLFKNYNADQLKALEWKYHLCCYGGPFIIALAYLFIDTSSRGRVYGPAIVCKSPLRLTKWMAADKNASYGVGYLMIGLFFG